jgi:hypothetical protein
MRGKVAIAASAAAVVAFAATGCGGDDSTIQSVSATTSSTSTTVAVSTEEFITAADARCAEANAAIANLSGDATVSSTAVQQQLDITKQTLTGLQALGSPEDPDGSLDDFYAAMQEQVSVLKQQAAALASGDTAASDTLGVQLAQAESDAGTAAASFGLEECGQPGSTLSDGSTTTTTPDPGAATPTATTPAAPVTPAPAPVTPAAPPTGGTGTGGATGGGAPPPAGGGGSSGGISP